MILVTGGTGLVGSHLIKTLVNSGEAVRAIYRKEIPEELNIDLVSWVKADILDVIELETAMEGINQVYHCAAVVSFTKKDAKNLQHTNIQGTANVVNACIQANVKKLVFVSSVAALGRIREGQMINETMQWTEDTSNSEYGKSKYLAEMEVWRGMGEGLNVVVVNPVIILGDSDWSKGSTAIFKSAYDEFPWYTNGSSGFVDVLDVVDAMIILMKSNFSNQRYILCGENLSYREVFTKIAKSFHKKPPYKKVTAFLAEIVWRIEGFKSFFSGKSPLLTKETSRTARATVQFDNSKLLNAIPNFEYRKIQGSIERICIELKIRNHLS